MNQKRSRIWITDAYNKAGHRMLTRTRINQLTFHQHWIYSTLVAIGQCSINTLAKLCRSNKRTVKASLSRLRELGLVDPENNPIQPDEQLRGWFAWKTLPSSTWQKSMRCYPVLVPVMRRARNTTFYNITPAQNVVFGLCWALAYLDKDRTMVAAHCSVSGLAVLSGLSRGTVRCALRFLHQNRLILCGLFTGDAMNGRFNIDCIPANVAIQRNQFEAQQDIDSWFKETNRKPMPGFIDQYDRDYWIKWSRILGYDKSLYLFELIQQNRISRFTVDGMFASAKEENALNLNRENYCGLVMYKIDRFLKKHPQGDPMPAFVQGGEV